MLTNSLILRRWSLNSLALECGLDLGDSFRASNKWSKETEKESLYKKPGSQVTKIKLLKLISAISHVDIRYHLIQNVWQEGHTISLIFFPKMLNLRLIKRKQNKITKKKETENSNSGTLCKWSLLFKSVKCHRQGETKKLEAVGTIHICLIPFLDPNCSQHTHSKQ